MLLPRSEVPKTAPTAKDGECACRGRSMSTAAPPAYRPDSGKQAQPTRCARRGVYTGARPAANPAGRCRRPSGPAQTRAGRPPACSLGATCTDDRQHTSRATTLYKIRHSPRLGQSRLAADAVADATTWDIGGGHVPPRFPKPHPKIRRSALSANASDDTLEKKCLPRR